MLIILLFNYLSVFAVILCKALYTIIPLMKSFSLRKNINILSTYIQIEVLIFNFKIKKYKFFIFLIYFIFLSCISLSILPSLIFDNYCLCSSDSDSDTEHDVWLEKSCKSAEIFTKKLIFSEIFEPKDVFQGKKIDEKNLITLDYLKYLVEFSSLKSKRAAIIYLESNPYFLELYENAKKNEMSHQSFNDCIKDYIKFLNKSIDNTDKDLLFIIENYKKIFNQLTVQETIEITPKINEISINKGMLGEFRKDIIKIQKEKIWDPNVLDPNKGFRSGESNFVSSRNKNKNINYFSINKP